MIYEGGSWVYKTGGVPFFSPLPIFPISPWFLPPAAIDVARRIKIAFPSHVLIDYFLTSMAEPDSFILNAFYSLK
jgi:hypothetical protein